VQTVSAGPIRLCRPILISQISLFSGTHYMCSLPHLVLIIKPRLHDTTCCQNRFYRLHRVYKHSTGFQTRLTTGLTNGCIVYTAGCQSGCTTRFDNRLNEQWLFVQHGCQTGCQPVGCLFTRYSRLSNLLYNLTTGCTTGLTTSCIV